MPVAPEIFANDTTFFTIDSHTYRLAGDGD
jgi:hypothetical protein